MKQSVKMPVVSPAELMQRKNRNRRTRVYFDVRWRLTEAYMEESVCVFLLLDADGCTLFAGGKKSFLSELKAKGICEGTVWYERLAGKNAISKGLKEDEASVSAGAEHTHPALRDYTLYFAPVFYTWEHKVLRYGGVAILTHTEDASADHLITVQMLATGIHSHMNLAHQSCLGFQSDPKGIMYIHHDTLIGTYTMTHHNDRFFTMLGAPVRSVDDTYFYPLHEVIDKRPRNRDFWDLMDKGIDTDKEDMELRIGGHPVQVMVTLEHRNAPAIRAEQTVLTIDTRKRVAHGIARQISNSAVTTFDTLIGESAAMRSAKQRARLLAGTDANLLILGASGTGKDVFAQAIHNASDRSDKPFVALNCGALPRDLIASELFGYDEGAFTGAKKEGNIGKFELADGGTLFLDEIGEMPLDLQATLLRAVEQKCFYRVGSGRMIEADIRIISATNAALSDLVAEKRFRADLFYRLGSMQLTLPSLKERGEDVLLLARHFIRSVCERMEIKPVKRLTKDAEALLLSHPFDGNVRELQNLIDSVVQFYPGRSVSAAQLKENLSTLSAQETISATTQKEDPLPSTDGRMRIRPSKDDILTALRMTDGSRSEAARQLGISRKTFYRYLERYGIRLPGN